MEKIKLTKNKYALVDTEDFDLISQYSWNCSNVGYAVRLQHSGGEKGRVHKTRKSRSLYMHHLIIGVPPKGKVVDHINLNKLDNRRSNLRFVSHSQNHANQKLQRNNTSGYKGVTKHRKKWSARIKFLGKSLYLGTYNSKSEAALAYDNAAKEYFKEHALLNLPHFN